MPTEDITLYAHWTANEYTITFDAGEGTTSTVTKDVTYGETYGELPIPTRTGYDFNGWYDGEGNQVTEDDIVNITEDTTLTAEWLGAEYTVTFDPNEGTVDPTSKQVRNEGRYGELPTPTKQGYNFVGWYDSERNKIESTTTVNLTSDITLTAKWEAIETILTVDPNGGTWEESTETQTFTQGYGTTKTISNPSQTPNGYTVTFDGNEGTAEENEIIQTTTFANWTLENGESFADGTYTFGEVAGTLTANYTGDSITLPGATKIGATFKGWYTQAEEGTRVGGAGDAWTPTEETTLFAQWEDINYTLTVNPNEGTWNGSTENQTVQGTYNSTTEIAEPTAPNGYTVTLNNNGTTTSSSSNKNI